MKLREAKHRRRSGLFLVDGSREITRALNCGYVLHDGFICEALTPADLHQTFTEANWRRVSETLIKRLAYRENPQGVVGVFEQRQTPLAQLVESLPAAALVLVTVGAAKPGNLGAMLRSADAAGCAAVIAADAVVDLYNPNCLRASTGSAFALPVASGPSQAVRDLLHKQDVRLIAADPCAQIAYTEVNFAGACAVVIGAEDAGLDDSWLQTADARASIPMHSRAADSLNASVAAGVLLFEAVRQRNSSGSSA